MTPDPKLPGVYAIYCDANYTVYIGSSALSIASRLAAHKRGLRSGMHKIRMQRAWNKYGEDTFKFVALENCSPAECLAREQFNLDNHMAIGFDVFNTCLICNSSSIRDATSRSRNSAAMKERWKDPEYRRKISLARRSQVYSGQKNAAKPYYFIDPEGTFIHGLSLRKFCQDRCLHYFFMRDVLQGRRESYKGWRHPTVCAAERILNTVLKEYE